MQGAAGAERGQGVAGAGRGQDTAGACRVQGQGTAVGISSSTMYGCVSCYWGTPCEELLRNTSNVGLIPP